MSRFCRILFRWPPCVNILEMHRNFVIIVYIKGSLVTRMHKKKEFTRIKNTHFLIQSSYFKRFVIHLFIYLFRNEFKLKYKN